MSYISNFVVLLSKEKISFLANIFLILYIIFLFLSNVNWMQVIYLFLSEWLGYFEGSSTSFDGTSSIFWILRIWSPAAITLARNSISKNALGAEVLFFTSLPTFLLLIRALSAPRVHASDKELQKKWSMAYWNKFLY